MLKPVVTLCVLIALSASGYAQADGALTPDQMQRLKAVKATLWAVDHKSLRTSVAELEKSSQPELNLEIKEAMAAAYADIVKDYKVEGQNKREWLYSMVCLNMAYLQFNSEQGPSQNASDLNKLIRRQLKKHLPQQAMKQFGFLYSI